MGSLQWLVRDMGVESSRVLFAGDSAGGGMVLSVLAAAKQKSLPMPSGGVLWSKKTGGAVRMNTIGPLVVVLLVVLTVVVCAVVVGVFCCGARSLGGFDGFFQWQLDDEPNNGFFAAGHRPSNCVVVRRRRAFVASSVTDQRGHGR